MLRTTIRSTACLILLASNLSIGVANAAMRLHAPAPRRVFQRSQYIPDHSHPHAIGAPARGDALVPVEFEITPNAAGCTFEYRTRLLDGSSGQEVNWTKFVATPVGGRWSGLVKVPAGGWYRLEVRCMHGGELLDSAGTEPFGVGEVFLIAGQSYAGGYNDAIMRIEDPRGRVVAYDTRNASWALADDPQPNAADGGTIWPVMCNALLPIIQVPIGLVNVAVDSTSSSQWLPGGPQYAGLASAGRAMERFRAVLWQQGESDVIKRTDTETYVRNLVSIRDSLAAEWGFAPPWLLAKSTLHPTVYKDPEHENWIRAAMEELYKQPGFLRGPDTDILDGENRGGPQSRRHFSAIGQRNAGTMWFAVVWCTLLSK